MRIAVTGSGRDQRQEDAWTTSAKDTNGTVSKRRGRFREREACPPRRPYPPPSTLGGNDLAEAAKHPTIFRTTLLMNPRTKA
jgi:hypothetical protein